MKKAILILFLISVGFSMKNPAYIYCTSLGYKYEVNHTIYGDQGLCVLPNGEKVDAWAFLTGRVAQNYSYCALRGYKMITIHDDSCYRLFTDTCAACIDENDDPVEVTELMNLSFDESVCGDSICDTFENYKKCSKDCPSGVYDGYCDEVKDGKCDPDCPAKRDVDCLKRNITTEIVRERTRVQVQLRNETNQSVLVVNNTRTYIYGRSRVSGGRLYVENKSINVLPNEVVAQANLRKVERTELRVVDENPIYVVKGTRTVRLFNLIPIEMPVEVEISAVNRTIIREKAPWWSIFVR